MDKSFITVTAEEAANTARSWQKGDSAVMIRGNLKATHQICAIDRLSPDEEKDLCEMAGINPLEAPRLENYLSPKKQLTDGRNR